MVPTMLTTMELEDEVGFWVLKQISESYLSKTWTPLRSITRAFFCIWRIAKSTTVLKPYASSHGWMVLESLTFSKGPSSKLQDRWPAFQAFFFQVWELLRVKKQRSTEFEKFIFISLWLQYPSKFMTFPTKQSLYHLYRAAMPTSIQRASHKCVSKLLLVSTWRHRYPLTTKLAFEVDTAASGFFYPTRTRGSSHLNPMTRLWENSNLKKTARREDDDCRIPAFRWQGNFVWRRKKHLISLVTLALTHTDHYLLT